jgi:hypothetical protein
MSDEEDGRVLSSMAEVQHFDVDEPAISVSKVEFSSVS